MTNSEKIKKAVKDYQGKYFKGQEINNSDTYLYIKKVLSEGFSGSTFFDTYVNVIYKSVDDIVFVQNRRWKFGVYHIDRYGYKRVNKAVFNRALKQYGFKIDKHSTNYTVERKPISV